MARRIGKFEEASGGALLLDEISEMDVRLQAKLLRDQERMIDRVGGARWCRSTFASSPRQIAAWSTPCARASSVRIYYCSPQCREPENPPLRERPADIIELAQYFIHKYAEANNVSASALCRSTPGAGAEPLAGQIAGENTRCAGSAAGHRGDQRRRYRLQTECGSISCAVRRPSCAAMAAETTARAWSGALLPMSSVT